MRERFPWQRKYFREIFESSPHVIIGVQFWSLYHVFSIIQSLNLSRGTNEGWFSIFYPNVDGVFWTEYAVSAPGVASGADVDRSTEK